MNAKLVLALIAVAVVAVSAKPATRLENAVNEAALAFRDAANDAISKTAEKATSEVGDVAKSATNLVSQATGAVTGGSSSGGGIMSTLGGWWNSFLSMFGMGKPSIPSLGALGGATSMLNNVPGVGGALGSAEKALSSATGRRKRSPVDTPASNDAATNGGDQNKKPDGADANKLGDAKPAVPATGAAPAATGAAGAATSANATANCTAPASGFSAFLQCLEAPLRWIGLMSPICPVAANSTANSTAPAVPTPGTKPEAVAGDTNGDGKVDDKDKKPDQNTPVDNTKKARRKRSPLDLLSTVESVAGGGKGAGGLAGAASGLLGGSGGLLGEAGGLLGAVTGTPCVLGWMEWITSLFGMIPNRCTLAKSVGGLLG